MAAPPRVTIAKPNRPNGVLSVPASATQKKAAQTPAKQPSQPPGRLKLIIRRLPPGLTAEEFQDIVGEEWKAGAGKVSWASYRAGKISKDPAKPSRPSRAYLNLTKPEHINHLSDKVRNTSFVDSKGSMRDACLLGPPTVEFAPYGRVPSGKPRKDARQGTIDQDPEFMSFLESLTNPVVKTNPADQEEEAAKSKEKVSVTPLVQYIKDKKANKGKEQAAAKAAKQSRHDKEIKSGDGKNAAQNNVALGKRSAQAVKVEKAARDAVKVLNKQAANVKGAPASQPGAKAQSVTPAVAPNNAANSALANKQRERGNVKAAAQILQRDLGIGGNPRGRGGKHAAANAGTKNASSNNQPPSKPATAPNPAKQVQQSAAPSVTSHIQNAPIAPALTTNAQPPIEPTANRANPKPAASQSTHQAPAKPQAPPPTSTQAFLKHANPSQGVTEPLLEEAFKAFGTVKKVEIDKKKGFAYIDFVEPEDLQKAIRASPIKVAQGQVQVLERKTGPQLQAKNNARVGAPMVNNANMRAPSMANNNTRGGPATGNTNFRGGHVNSRGGLLAGGRGHVRGRGGMGRGGSHHVNQANKGGSSGPGSANPPAPAAPASQASAGSAQANATPTEPSGG